MINSRKKSSFRINIHPFHLLSVMKKTQQLLNVMLLPEEKMKQYNETGVIILAKSPVAQFHETKLLWSGLI